jgi:hypothetical protein
LSFAAAGFAVFAGRSTLSDKTQVKDRMAARNDLGVAEMTENFWKKLEAGRACSLMTLSCSTADLERGRSQPD